VIVILLTIYDLFIWIYRLFFRREAHLQGRLNVMNQELAQKWPIKDSCSDHMNEEENERMMKGIHHFITHLKYPMLNRNLQFLRRTF
jgi:hypothetical protein